MEVWAGNVLVDVNGPEGNIEGTARLHLRAFMSLQLQIFVYSAVKMPQYLSAVPYRH